MHIVWGLAGCPTSPWSVRSTVLLLQVSGIAQMVQMLVEVLPRVVLHPVHAYTLLSEFACSLAFEAGVYCSVVIPLHAGCGISTGVVYRSACDGSVATGVSGAHMYHAMSSGNQRPLHDERRNRR